MTAIEYLNQISQLENRIKRLSWRIQHERERATELNLSYGSEQVQNGKADMDPAYAKALQNVVVLEETLERLAKELSETTNTVVETINQLEDAEANVLTLRYISGYDFFRISKAIGYAYEGTRDVHTRALGHLEELIN